MTTRDSAHSVLLQTHSALVQGTTEQEITAAIALCTDAEAFVRLFYLELDSTGSPVQATVVASWRDGALWQDDPLLKRAFTGEECPLIGVLIDERDLVHFAENFAGQDYGIDHPCFENVQGLVAIKLYGIVHIEHPSQWHSIMCIGWPTPHTFNSYEKYIYTSIAETVSAVVSNHRLRLEALENVTRLKQLDRLKSAFLHGVSHELRTPLTALITITEGVLAGADGPLNDELVTDLGYVHEQSEHLLAMINDLLDMANIEAGKLKPYPTTFNVQAVIEDAIHTVTPLARAKGLSLTTDLPVGLPVVLADRARIGQVLLNLLSNAIKFSTSGTISITAQNADSHVTVSVSDQGMGIKASDQTAIFDRFYRVDNLSVRSVGGNGLGLPISKYLVEQNGGHIWVESTSGNGATFYFSIPISRGLDESSIR